LTDNNTRCALPEGEYGKAVILTVRSSVLTPAGNWHANDACGPLVHRPVSSGPLKPSVEKKAEGPLLEKSSRPAHLLLSLRADMAHCPSRTTNDGDEN
jgi:hypothetical protein